MSGRPWQARNAAASRIHTMSTSGLRRASSRATALGLQVQVQVDVTNNTLFRATGWERATRRLRSPATRPFRQMRRRNFSFSNPFPKECTSRLRNAMNP